MPLWHYHIYQQLTTTLGCNTPFEQRQTSTQIPTLTSLTLIYSQAKLRPLPGKVAGDAHLECVSQVLESRLQDPGLCVHVRDAEHENTASQVVVEVDALADLAPGHGQQHRAATVLTRLVIWGRVSIRTRHEPEDTEEVTQGLGLM